MRVASFKIVMKAASVPYIKAGSSLGKPHRPFVIETEIEIETKMEIETERETETEIVTKTEIETETEIETKIEIEV